MYGARTEQVDLCISYGNVWGKDRKVVLCISYGNVGI